MIAILGLVFDGWVFRSMVSVAFSGSRVDAVTVCCQVGNSSEILLGVGAVRFLGIISKMCF